MYSNNTYKIYELLADCINIKKGQDYPLNPLVYFRIIRCFDNQTVLDYDYISKNIDRFNRTYKDHSILTAAYLSQNSKMIDLLHDLGLKPTNKDKRYDVDYKNIAKQFVVCAEIKIRRTDNKWPIAIGPSNTVDSMSWCTKSHKDLEYKFPIQCYNFTFEIHRGTKKDIVYKLDGVICGEDYDDEQEFKYTMTKEEFILELTNMLQYYSFSTIAFSLCINGGDVDFMLKPRNIMHDIVQEFV